MGNYKFRLSDMVPSAWFNKMMDRTRSPATRSHHPPRTPKVLLPNRSSHYFSSRPEADGYVKHALLPRSNAVSDAELPLLDSTKRSKKRFRRKQSRASPSDDKLVNSSVSTGCGRRACKANPVTEFTMPPSPESASCPCNYDVHGEQKNSQETDVGGRLHLDAVVSSAIDVIINVQAKSLLAKKLDSPDMGPARELPPIITKAAKKEAETIELESKFSDDETSSHLDCRRAVRKNNSRMRSSPPGLRRLRVRANSPRLTSRMLQAYHAERTKIDVTTTEAGAKLQKKRMSKSLAVVKLSSDPRKDFRDSMVEMIVEKNMSTSKDLEELLACYLLLNSKEYHDLIVDVFDEVWFEIITKC